MSSKVTHMRVECVGDHTGCGWWFSNGRPKIHKVVVIEAMSYHRRGLESAIEFFHKMGAQKVEVIPVPSAQRFIVKRDLKARTVTYTDEVDNDYVFRC